MSEQEGKTIINKMNDETSEFYVKPDEFETEELKGFKPPIKKSQGVYLDNPIINLSNLKNMTVRNDDVFLIGFQKSGFFNIIWFNSYFK